MARFVLNAPASESGDTLTIYYYSAAPHRAAAERFTELQYSNNNCLLWKGTVQMNAIDQ